MIGFILVFIIIFCTLFNVKLLKEKDKEAIFLTLFVHTMSIAYFLSLQPIKIFLSILIIALSIYCNYYNKKWIKYIVTAYFSYFLLTVWEVENLQSITYSIPSTITLFLFIYILLSFLFKEKIAFIIWNTLILILRFANIIYKSFRYGNITIMDILSIPTAANIINEYEITIDANMCLMASILIIVCIFYFIFVKNEDKNLKKSGFILWVCF